MSKGYIWWLLLALLVGIAAAVVYFKFFYIPSETVIVHKRRGMEVMTLALPTSKDTAVFGPKYWKALHTVTEHIPCSVCRDKAVPFMEFFHDIVNKQTGKQIMYPDNYNKHLEAICQLPKA